MGKRMKVLFGQRRMQVLVTMAVLLLAVAVVIGSGANFNAKAANADNTFTAGNLVLTSDNTVTFNTDVMVPGETRDGQFQLTNTGNVGGTLWLTPQIDGVASTGLQTVLEVRVYEQGTPAPGWTSLTTASGTPVSAGALGAGAARTFVVEVRFPNNTTGGVNGLDNIYMNQIAVFDLNWEIVAGI